MVTGGILTGKTDWASFSLFDFIRHAPGLWWWIAGLNWQIDAMWDKFAQNARIVGARVREQPYRQIWFPNGAKFEGVTGKNIGLLKSKHPRGVIVDEIGSMPHRAVEAIEARCVNAERVLWMGSAEYHPDLIRFMRYGRDHQEDRWALVQVATPEAGLVTAEELKHLQHELPARVWNRDILGVIPEGEGAVFQKLDRVNIWSDGSEVRALAPREGAKYVIGFDQAKTVDFSVAAVRKASTKQIVRVDRWQKLDYHVQAELLLDLAERYNRAPIFADATGAAAVMEILERERLKRKRPPHLEPVTFTNALKREMVDRLTVELQNEELKWPGPEYGEVYQTVTDEFRVYEMRRSQAGLTWTYTAPEGSHDDTVTAIGLAVLYGAEVDSDGPIRFADWDERLHDRVDGRREAVPQ